MLLTQILSYEDLACSEHLSLIPQQLLKSSSDIDFFQYTAVKIYT